MEINHFSIITPCYKSRELIETTIESVLSSKALSDGSVALQYIVCDGGSTDGTLDIIEKIFTSADRDNITTELISEKDSGMYDALAKGFRRATGNIISYINAGDLLSPHAFEIVSEIFINSEIKWLTGLDVVYNEKGHIIRASLPFRYRRKLIQCGLYNLGMLPHIQQESTFWDAELLKGVDYDCLSRCRYAGDYHLWKCFSEKEQLYIVEAWLGGFKVHRGQLSGDSERYNSEMSSLARRPGIRDYLGALLEKILWNLPYPARKVLNRSTLLRFDHLLQKYTLPG